MRWGLGFREHRYFALEEKKYLVRKCNFTKSCAYWQLPYLGVKKKKRIQVPPELCLTQEMCTSLKQLNT